MQPSAGHWLAAAVAFVAFGCGGSLASNTSNRSHTSTSDAAISDARAAAVTAAPPYETGSADAAIEAQAVLHVARCPSGPSFTKMTPVTLGNAPYFVRAGDMNGDGHLDVAVPNYGDGTLDVLLGDGTGTLRRAPGSPYPVGRVPCSVAIGDFNGDGFADVAVTTAGGQAISLLLGRSAGPMTMATGSPFLIGGQSTQTSAPAVGDFNGDGNLDLAVPVGGSLRVLLGDGHGGLTAVSSVSVSGNLTTAVATDLNGDGLLDVAATNFTGNSVNVMLGDGHGGLSSTAGSPWAIGSSPSSAAAGDFNRDGRMDLAVADYGAASVSILLGDGQGALVNAPGSPIFVGANPTDIATSDFDGDGNLDLAVTANGNSSVTILRGGGAGTFANAVGSPIPVGPYPGSLTAGDFNEDGKIDIALTNNIPGTWTVSLLLNTCAP